VWGTRIGLRRAVLGSLVLLSAIGISEAQTSGTHEGVATCASSACHGRSVANPHGVRQNEYATWQAVGSAGAHSRAWQSLGSARGRSIAARLGIGDAQTSPQCVGCHVEEAAQHGPQFQVSDGVGCESCHGAAGGWLSTHDGPRVTHADNVAHGMVALDDPKTRAGVCLDCHFGGADDAQFVPHRLMAAGHPRISFELDLFSDLQRHYDLDSYYAAKKPIAGSAKMWVVGQAMALERALALYGSHRGAGSGVFPELYFFDCQSCHRAISSDEDWRPRAARNPGRPIPLGMPPFNDSNMIMLAAAVHVAAPGMEATFNAQVHAFHLALIGNREGAVASAQTLAATAHSLSDTFAAAKFSSGDIFAMLDRLMSDSIASRYSDYAGSEQAEMAVETLTAALQDAHALKPADLHKIVPAIERLRVAVRDPNTYSPANFEALMEQTASIFKGIGS
jgi:hypothetical protein